MDKVADGAANWSITSDLPQTWSTEGVYHIVARAEDHAGNSSPRAWVSFTAGDDTPPTCSITYPQQEQTIDGPLGHIDGTATDEGAGIDYVEIYLVSSRGFWDWDRQEWRHLDPDYLQWIWQRADGQSDWQVTSGLPEIWHNGHYRIGARSVDLAGNSGYAPRVYFTIQHSDTTPPEVVITHPDDGGHYPVMNHFAGTADDGDGIGVDVVECRLYCRDPEAERWRTKRWCWESHSWRDYGELGQFTKVADGTNHWRIDSDLPDQWMPGRRHLLVVSARDRAGNQLTWMIPLAAHAWFTVGNRAPIADAGDDATVEADTVGGADITLDGSGSSDPDGDELTYTWFENGEQIATGETVETFAELGEHTYTLSVSDGQADPVSDDVTITVVDTTAPDFMLTVVANRLWPPNHRMVLAAIVDSVSDICDPDPSVDIAVSADEPINDVGDGNTDPDWEIVETEDAWEVYLRAERSGASDGREYTIDVTVTDDSGNFATDSATVTVPHDRGKKTGRGKR